MGLLPLLWPPALLLWVLVGVALPLFRRSGREAIVAVTALLLPTAVWSYGEWLLGGSFTGAAHTIWGYLTTPSGFEPWTMDAARWALGGLLVVLTGLSVASYLLGHTAMRTRPSRIVTFFLGTLGTTVTMFLLPCRSVMIFPVLATGAAVVLPIYFVRYRGAVPAVLYGAVLIAVVVVALT